MFSSAPQTLSLDIKTTAPLTIDIELLPQPSVSMIIAHRRLRVPIELAVARTNEGYWIATHPKIMTYGIGDAVSEAVNDYLSMLIDLYEELNDSENELSNHLKKDLEYLRTVFTS